MAKRVNSYTELFSQMSKNIPLAMEIIATLVQSKWKELIQENFYDEYDPVYYERSKAIMEALVKSDVSFNGGGYHIRIYIDMNTMNYIHLNTEGLATGEEIVDIIERKGFTMSNGVRREPSEAFDTIVTMLHKDFKKLVKEVMGDTGVKVM